MFSLGLVGILLIAAGPLLVVYAVAGLALKVAVVAVNRSSAPVRFAACNVQIGGVAFAAWLTSVALFAACGLLDYWLTRNSGDAIMRLYPLLQQLAGLALFFWFLVQRAISKSTEPPASATTRTLWSFAVSAASTLLLVAAANVWHFSAKE